MSCKFTSSGVTLVFLELKLVVTENLTYSCSDGKVVKDCQLLPVQKYSFSAYNDIADIFIGPEHFYRLWPIDRCLLHRLVIQSKSSMPKGPHLGISP